ncbi:cell division protein SepF [Virgibacillus sp. 179-BFC.A HS]|uniref:Cell division protein SepF n=1 Tax=Tigheibacillus jepli TaxID=3035914 RepID=A0ABU5CI01_9BACI|nr:cell division protein SepF [Virgibacillus sp. 179-BFC.A HS]MDY0405954.1 cell division protein SepF [Virgibacillus sp. 179-BFC.A HS]
MSIKNKIKSYFTLDDEYEYVEENERQNEEPAYAPNDDSPKKNVVNLASIQQQNVKIVLCEPRTYNEAQEIADNIVNRRAVVVNLKRLDHGQAIRVLDFLSGTVYAVNGVMQKLSADTFLCAPDNLKITGSISESMEERAEYNKGW